MKVERLEWKVLALARERLLFRDKQNVRMITESLQQPAGRSQQIGPSGS